MMMRRSYSKEPGHPAEFTRQFDRFYTRFARWYAGFIRAFPLWRRWLDHALPYIEGQRVLEISFGTGYLLSRYARRFETYGVDLNYQLAQLARGALTRQAIDANLQVADVVALPYPDGIFDCVVNTMAFSGYPEADAAIAEIKRVLCPGGRLVLIDVAYPVEERPAGFLMARMWKLAGDLLRDMKTLLAQHGFSASIQEIGGFGSVQLFVCQVGGGMEHLNSRVQGA